jgi:hypothetical protein
MFTSFALSTVVMVIGDLALIPSFGLTGAACAAVAGSFAGALICVLGYRRSEGIRLSEVLPRSRDLASLARIALGLLPRRKDPAGAILE